MANHFNKMFVWKVSLIAAIGGLLFGYDWVVIGGAKPFYEAFFQITGEENVWVSSWTVSSALVGCLVGAVLSGFLTDHLGRKSILLLSACLFAVSAIWTAATSNFYLFVFARILGGVGIGLASNVSPMYIAEVAPSNQRGKLVSINQLAIVIGVLAAQIVNLLIYNVAPVSAGASTSELLDSWNGHTGWRLMFAAEAIPAVVFFVLGLLIPESPRWLVNNSRNNKAFQVLELIGGVDFAHSELNEIQSSLESPIPDDANLPLVSSRIRRVLALGLFLAVFQQWCGINVIFNYAEEIFTAAGYSVSGLMLNIAITGVVNLLFTFVAIHAVDLLGRRPLMLIGAAGLSICYAAIGISYFFDLQGVYVLMFVLIAIAIYAMTLAPITWVLLAEIFPNQIRGAAMSMCVGALWVACFLLTVTFKPINNLMGPAGTFWLYGGICLVGYLVLFKLVPETKGRSLEAIQQEVLNP